MAEDNNISEIDMDTVDDIVLGDDLSALGVTPTPEPGEDDIPELETNFAKPTGDDLVLDDPAPAGEEEVIYQELGGILKDKGFFSGEEAVDFKNADDLAGAFDKEVQARLTDRQREIQDYMNEGLDFSEMSRISTAIDEVNNISDEQVQENEKLAENLVRLEFRKQGLDADRYINLFKRAGTLAEEGTKALHARRTGLNSMLQDEKSKAAAQKTLSAEKEQTRIADFNKSLEAKEILGRKVSERTTEKLKNIVNSPVGYTQDGQPLNAVMNYREENPIEFERNLNYLFMVTDGFKDLKAFDRSAETRVSSRLRSAVSKVSAPDSIMSAKKPESASGNLIDMDTIDDIV